MAAKRAKQGVEKCAKNEAPYADAQGKWCTANGVRMRKDHVKREAANTGRVGGIMGEKSRAKRYQPPPRNPDVLSQPLVLWGLFVGAPLDLQQIGISASQNGFSEKVTLRRR